MLTGGFQWSEPSDRVFKRTCFTLTLSNGRELRYIDDRQMGRVYYVSPDQLGEIPQYAETWGRTRSTSPSWRVQGAAPSVSRGDQGHHHERKGYLSIGNAYVDEILWDAEIYPFRKKRDLSDDDLQRILDSSARVIREAVGQVREAMGEDIHRKRRDFLKCKHGGITVSWSCAPSEKNVKHPWVNILILAFVTVEFISGFWGLVSGSRDEAVFIIIHRIAGYGLVVLMVWKVAIILFALRNRKRGRMERTHLSCSSAC
ncbi:Formamidopyrimidine-DNA glycosylase [Geodia barretti]|uniref:Formamidopyrimidine-DNA glycosylase n=1 Tax=Geodia barretti TaxID=519541 RepID=A0AA35X4I8_GEOBA|nr:Formamidopyrimidine-DNA glycosylase [Geodia barretti]